SPGASSAVEVLAHALLKPDLPCDMVCSGTILRRESSCEGGFADSGPPPLSRGKSSANSTASSSSLHRRSDPDQYFWTRPPGFCSAPGPAPLRASEREANVPG